MRNLWILLFPTLVSLLLTYLSPFFDSTTIGLIERYYDPDEGSIEFEGVDLRELNIQWYRDQIGIVSQEVSNSLSYLTCMSFTVGPYGVPHFCPHFCVQPTLFSGSIADNIAYGAPNSTRAEIEAAAIAANADDFIQSCKIGLCVCAFDNFHSFI